MATHVIILTGQFIFPAALQLFKLSTKNYPPFLTFFWEF